MTTANENLIRYISSIETMTKELNKAIDDEEVVKVLKLIIQELSVEGMNYSAFCQYFNIHNMNYSVFKKLTSEEKLDVLKFVIKPYIETRHGVYLSHGYSHIILQVLSDTYSHKRKGSYGAKKIAAIMKDFGVADLVDSPEKSFDKEVYYLLSDKRGKKLFDKFATEYGVRLSIEGRQAKKYPDALIKIKDEFYIVEQKNMKESGGGQDKQTTEITDFIYRKPEFEHLHYVTFVDGIYVNEICKNARGKKCDQYKDVISALTKFKANYFVNTFAFKKMIQDMLFQKVDGSRI